MGKNRQDAPLHLKIDIDYVITTFILSAAFFLGATAVPIFNA